MRVAKLVVGPESGLRDCCSRIKRYIPGKFVLQTRRWQDGIK